MSYFLTNLTGTLKTGTTRLETFNGRSYRVAPATLIVSGVLPGGDVNGKTVKCFYPDDELMRDPMAWNHMPIVLYHPVVNGQHVSARTPDILSSQGMGFVFHASYKDKLKAELWFDVEHTRRVDGRVLNSLETAKPIELSTGLLAELEDAPEGAKDSQGREYDYIARNYRPDHVAILPDMVGACSLKDGCGVLVNTQPHLSSNSLPCWTIINVEKTQGTEKLSASDYAYVPDPGKPSTWKLRIDDKNHVAGALAALGKGFRGKKVDIPANDLPAVRRKVMAAWKKFNPNKKAPSMLGNSASDMSYDERMSEIRCAFRDAHPVTYDPETGSPIGQCYIIAIFDSYVIYQEGGSYWDSPSDPSYYRQSYTMDFNGEVTFGKKSEEVERVVRYEPVTNAIPCRCGGDWEEIAS